MLTTMQEKFYGDGQRFLGKLYQVLFSTTYFGLFRIGEMTFSMHVVKAWDVHIATNKKKMQFILWSSKTHSRGNKPQNIKITSNEAIKGKKSNPFKFCPFQLLLNYLAIRPPTKDDNEQFFCVCRQLASESTPYEKHFVTHFKTIKFTGACILCARAQNGQNN